MMTHLVIREAGVDLAVWDRSVRVLVHFCSKVKATALTTSKLVKDNHCTPGGAFHC